MVADVSISSAINQQRQTDKTVAALAQDFDQFLNLLTTQLQNQDPLNPMDSSEFTNQIVQFSQVEQAINTNKKLDSLVQMQLSNAFSTSLGYVGLDVRYISGEFHLDSGKPVTFDYSLGEAAMENFITILDETGASVYSERGNLTAGLHSFTWDGKTAGGQPLPSGTYQVRVDAIDSNEEVVDSSTVVQGNVKGVETQNGLIFLLVGERAIPLSNVINAHVPAPSPDSEGESGA